MSNKIDNTAGRASALSPQTRDRPKAINGGEKTRAMTSAEIHAPVEAANRKKYCALQEIENRHDGAARPVPLPANAEVLLSEKPNVLDSLLIHPKIFQVLHGSMVNKSQSMIANQLRAAAQLCRQLGSPLYAALLKQVAVDVEMEGPCWVVLQGHEADPLGSALPLRFIGAVHRLVLQGRAPTLARHYPSVGGNAEADGLWTAFLGTVEEHRETLRELVLCPVQTNAVGRSAALLSGFLLVAQETGLPLRLLEMGASAGLNLRWDHYRYETGGAAWGDPNSPVRLVDQFLEGQPPFDVASHVVERSGCDINPLDPCSAEGRLTLMSYVWPDQTHHIELLQGAIEVADKVPVMVERSDAPDWLASRLDGSSVGVATVVYHSIFIQYLSKAGRDRVQRIIEDAGRRATRANPLAYLRMEPGANQIEVRLTTRPGGAERLVATSGYHGQQVRCVNADMAASPL